VQGLGTIKTLEQKTAPNKAFSERNLEIVKNMHFIEKNSAFSHLLSTQGDVLS
jgi:hypothetical protein